VTVRENEKELVEIARMDYLGWEIVLLAQIHDDYGLRVTRVSQLKQRDRILDLVDELEALYK
jgi:hypothetical protein